LPAPRPYVVFLHDVEAWTPLDPVMRGVLAGAHLRLANSRYTAGRVESANPDGGRVHACPLALPPDTVNGQSQEEVESPSSSDVVIVGRMIATERYKGHDQLIEAWPRVRTA